MGVATFVPQKRLDKLTDRPLRPFTAEMRVVLPVPT